MKHTNFILETFEYFSHISSKSIHIISNYTVSKLDQIFETQCRSILNSQERSLNTSVTDGKLRFHFSVHAFMSLLQNTCLWIRVHKRFSP